jgi:hypothetical protein
MNEFEDRDDAEDEYDTTESAQASAPSGSLCGSCAEGPSPKQPVTLSRQTAAAPRVAADVINAASPG